MRRLPVARLGALAGLIAIAFLASGCEAFSSPQNTFAPGGEQAEDLKNLFLLVMWPALAVLILVWGGIAYIIFRYRRRSDSDPMPVQVHGNTRLELGWTIAPALLLLAFVPPVLTGIVDLESEPEGAMIVDVQGVQWAWLFTYPEAGPEGAPVTSPPGELHIPVGRKVLFRLNSPDVLHSFWVPKLGGKKDVVPGRTNTMWLQADTPGTYAGQCAEFCGLDHSRMDLIVIAESEEDFQAWLDAQSAPPAGDADDGDPDEGEQEPPPDGDADGAQEGEQGE